MQPPYRNGLEPERVSEIQQARMLNAMAQAVSELGVTKVTVASVVERAGVSRRTFYEFFDDISDCFAVAFDRSLEHAWRHVRDAYGAEATWLERIRASLVALLAFLDEDRFKGRVLIVDSLSAGPAALRRRQQALAHVIAAVDEGRTQRQNGVEPSPLTTEGVVGGVLSILRARLLEENSRPLLELANPLMSMIVLPYLGTAAAQRELARETPTAPEPPAQHGDIDALHELGMRVTYRTIRVLGAIAASPGSSNRKVASAAGISDQGQTSKLLARLQELGLIENANAQAALRGISNAWTLTSQGWQAHQILAREERF